MKEEKEFKPASFWDLLDKNKYILLAFLFIVFVDIQ